MQFTINSLEDPRNAPKKTTISVGRFSVALGYDATMLGGLSWRTENEDAVRDGEFPLSGRINHGPDAVTLVTLFPAELGRYEQHLLVEEQIAANPEKYRKERQGATFVTRA